MNKNDATEFATRNYQMLLDYGSSPADAFCGAIDNLTDTFGCEVHLPFAELETLSGLTWEQAVEGATV